MLIKVVDSKRIDCPIVSYESDVIPSKGDSVSMNETNQYPGFVGMVLGVSHKLWVEGLGQYPKAEFTVVLEMKEEKQ